MIDIIKGGNTQILPVSGKTEVPEEMATIAYRSFEHPTKCPKGHKLKVIGHSCCDDICKCKCGKWFRCGLGSLWRYYD